jgi:hypothetical protein
VEFLTGQAGTGKTYNLKQRIEEDPAYGYLASTTGISAINLGTTTVHSLLHYFGTAELQDNYVSGRLAARIRKLHHDGKYCLCIDEVSMMPAAQLDLIFMAIEDANAGDQVHPPLEPKFGLVLTGDFCQLPPVSKKGQPVAKYAFHADCWPHFADNTTRLIKVWRQADVEFLEALNLARSGQGRAAADRLRDMNADFGGMDMHFDGTTVMAKNIAVDAYNRLRLSKLDAPEVTLRNERWGMPISDWNDIPDSVVIREGALVMMLSNTRERDKLTGEVEFLYANGDQAHIETASSLEEGGALVTMRLKRNYELHHVGRITRFHTQKSEPTHMQIAQIKAGGEAPYYDEEIEKWVIGAVTYWPLRVAYATTVHKSQGLTLDSIQVDCRDGFFGFPNLAYVALSRCKTLAGLRIVGGVDTLAARIKIHPEVGEWL